MPEPVINGIRPPTRPGHLALSSRPKLGTVKDHRLCPTFMVMEKHPNRKLIVKAVVVTLGSLACIFLGLQGWSMAYIDWSSQNVLDASHLLPTVLIPTFLLIVGILSVANFVRGVREGKRQS